MISDTDHPPRHHEFSATSRCALGVQGPSIMHESYYRNMVSLAIAVAAAAAAGCERPTEKKAVHPALAVLRVEVVKPERHTVQRSVAEPGQLQAYETTPIHAKIAGYVRSVNVHIGYVV